jgi:hypothetical protein
MTQPRKKSGTLAALACPTCEECGGTTRFVGLESHPDGKSDLCTYECEACEHMQVARLTVMPRLNGTPSTRGGSLTA